jgi:hypothetical protein
MHIALEGLLVGAGLAAVLIIFEYIAISREVAERSKRIAKKVDWDSSQKSRLRNMINFGVALTVGGAIGAWWVWG